MRVSNVPSGAIVVVGATILSSLISIHPSSFASSLFFCDAAASSSSSSSSSSQPPGSSSSSSLFPALKPDRFVSASPLIVGAVCGDGVALVACHTAHSLEPLLLEEELEEEERQRGLLVDDEDGDEEDDGGGSGDNVDDEATVNDDDHHPPTRLRDLPSSHRGPFRIEQVDGTGTTFVGAGWRTDCSAVASRCRAITAEETATYGDDHAGRGLEYGRLVADGLSQWLAQCAFSDNVRALSCVGLLAAACGNDQCGGFLWLFDATGAYRARAHAVGHGADCVNRRLVRMDFSRMTKEEGARALLKTIAEEGFNGTNDFGWSLPDSTKVEVAIVDSAKRTMKRIRQTVLESRRPAEGAEKKETVDR